MANLTSSGYLTTEATVAWTSGQSLNSLSDDEYTDLSDEIDNSTNKYLSVDLLITLASAAFTGTDSILEIFLVRSVDGTTYPNWTGNVTTDEQENDQYLVGAVKTSGATEANTINTVQPILLPPGKYKWGFRNRTGVSTAASGNTAEWRPHSVAI